VVVFELVAVVVRRREDRGVVVLQWWREAAAMVVREDGAAESWWSDFDVQWRCGEDGGAVLMVVDGDGAAGCVEEMVDLLAWRMRCGEGSWWWCAELRWLSETAARMEKDGGGWRDVKVRGDGGYCFRRVAVVAGEEMAAAAAMVGGREIRVKVSCVRWRR